MGNKESVDHHVLLYGQQGHGKTNFLYDNFLNGKWSEEQTKVQSSLGYNYELIQAPSNQKYGVWDISGHTEFSELQNLFLKTVPFTGILYILRPMYVNGVLTDDKLKQIGTARQQINQLINNRYFHNKFIMIILNIEEEEQQQDDDAELELEKAEEIIEEIKELLKYDEFGSRYKGISIIERGNYSKLWEKVSHLIEECKK